MAKKKVSAVVKIQIPAGGANPAPPVGTALGPHGVAIMDFCKEYNAKTEAQKGTIVPVEITIFEDRSFTFILKTPPTSVLIKQAAEAEGLDKVFQAAGLEWREPGCSMCVGINGDLALPNERVASTSNRNFVGRQGPGVRTHLVSPAMAAAAAVTGHFTDVRTLMGKQ